MADEKKKIPLPRPRGILEGEYDPTAGGGTVPRRGEGPGPQKGRVSPKEWIEPRELKGQPTDKMPVYKSLGKALRGDDEEEGLY